jgi:hypothetical protein
MFGLYLCHAAGAKMKVVVALAAVLICSGCASKTVDLYYYPNVQSTEHFSRIAQKECAKIGLDAVPQFGAINWSGGRSYVSFQCEARPGTPANPISEPPDLPTSFLPDFLK